MRLQTKISLAILPLVAVTIFSLGTWFVMRSTIGIKNVIYQAIERELEDYVANTVADLQGTLKKHGLSAVPSFVADYQQRALNAALGLRYFDTGHLMIMGEKGEVLFCSRGDKDEVHSRWIEIAGDISHQTGSFTRGQNDSGSVDEMYIGTYFKPWKWTMLYAISFEETFAYGRAIRNGTLAAAVLSTLIGFLFIFLVLLKFVIRPVDTMMDAAKRIALRQPIGNIPVTSTDELGTLARAMEEMAHAIQTYQDEQLDWQRQLEHRIAERTANLIESEERYRKVVDAMIDGLMIAGEDGIIQFANTASSEMYGYPLEELLGMHATKLIHPDYHNEFGRLAKELTESGVFAGNTIDLRKDGSTFHTEIKGVKILFQGKSCFLAVIRDVTERKQAEQAIADSEQRLSEIIEFLPDPTFVIDIDGRVIAWNRAIENMSGADKKEMIGKGEYAYAVPFYGEPRPMLIDLVLTRDKNWESKYQTLKEEDGLSTEGELFTPSTSGNKRYLAATACRLYDAQGNVVGAIETLRDVTDTKRTEQEREQLIIELKDALAQVRTLSGLLPMCAKCKKVRDDKGYWNQLETYISQHTDADISHGLCPACMDEMYKGQEWYEQGKKKGKFQ